VGLEKLCCPRKGLVLEKTSLLAGFGKGVTCWVRVGKAMQGPPGPPNKTEALFASHARKERRKGLQWSVLTNTDCLVKQLAGL